MHCKLCFKLSQIVGLWSKLKAKVPQQMLTIEPVTDYSVTLCGYVRSDHSDLSSPCIRD